MDENDHRSIGNRMDLFHQQDEGPGMVFWHPRGFAVYQVIENYIRRKMKSAGFREVRTPQLLAHDLWEKSGHRQKFGDHMFGVAGGDREFALKPMSCPAHVQIFKKGLRSFRDLPIRLSEFGVCHRNEPSGALHGLMRTRAFVQDDAHIFCAEEHVEAEVSNFCALLGSVYADFGFTDTRVVLSTRPEMRAGSDAIWDRAEAALAAAARSAEVDYQIDPGEGAFYGPKLDYFLLDNQGREWQCGTVQLDFVLPVRLDASYIDTHGHERKPVIIHHAVLGSIERFVGILLEHYEGDLPLWLAPDQIVVASINDDNATYANLVAKDLEVQGYRVVTDNRSERLPKKVVDARNAGIPILMVIGKREARDGTVSLRNLDGTQRVLEASAVADFLNADAFK